MRDSGERRHWIEAALDIATGAAHAAQAATTASAKSVRYA
jgi:hypothetical protein